MLQSSSTHARRIAAFLEGMRERGYVEGQSVEVAYRFGNFDRAACHAPMPPSLTSSGSSVAARKMGKAFSRPGGYLAGGPVLTKKLQKCWLMRRPVVLSQLIEVRQPHTTVKAVVRRVEAGRPRAAHSVSSSSMLPSHGSPIATGFVALTRFTSASIARMRVSKVSIITIIHADVYS